jgi:hypothetical protein
MVGRLGVQYHLVSQKGGIPFRERRPSHRHRDACGVCNVFREKKKETGYVCEMTIEKNNIEWSPPDHKMHIDS